MTTLAIDIETFSSVDIKKCGLYKYVEADDFEVLLFGYSFEGRPVQVIDLTSEGLPAWLAEALVSNRVLKTARNANFERVCLSKMLGVDIPVEQWSCTMAKASMLGLPLGLDGVAKALRLPQQKDSEGKALIKFFCTPCKPTKVNGQRTRNRPSDAPEKWAKFVEYCRQDVVVESEIRAKVAYFEPLDFEKRLYCLDQKINDTGVLLDPLFVDNAIRIDAEYRARLTEEAIQLTGLNNPNSAAQLKDWLTIELPEATVDNLTKADVPLLLAQADSEIVRRVLGIRQEMAKTSVKKYDAMRKVVCKDDRVRGLLQYYGANRTGRWAGRLVQVQNLPQNHLADLDLARQTVLEGDGDMLELLFGNVPDTLSQLIRTAFVAPGWSRFIVADFSAIEARVIAWLAGERWRLDVFNTHGKIYEASAAQMFGVPIASVTKGSDLRQKGKVSELALGYQGGPNALISMGALKMGVEEAELPKLVKMWRNANKAIVKLWQNAQDAALDCVRTGAAQVLKVPNSRAVVAFHVHNGNLFITLPSGRSLCYVRPAIKEGQFGDALTYEGMNQTTKVWGQQDTYGGKLVENMVQAIARDCLAEAMLRLDDAGCKIVMHVHDEVVLECEEGEGSLEEVNKIMGQPLSWAYGLPLTADSYETFYYKKD